LPLSGSCSCLTALTATQPRALPRGLEICSRAHASPIHDRPPVRLSDRKVRRQPRKRRGLRVPLDHGMSAFISWGWDKRSLELWSQPSTTYSNSGTTVDYVPEGELSA
jgi:hypothetical protein